MNKNAKIALAILGAVAAGGMAVYYAMRPTYAPMPEAPTQTVTTPPPTSTTTTSTTVITVTASAPTVQTGANAVPYTTAVVLTGTVNPNGASTVYWYEYGTTNALGTRSISQGIGSGYSTINTPIYITGLRTGTTYYYRLSAQNSLGTVNGATLSFMTSSVPPPQGTAPTTKTTAATDVSRTTANLHGQVNPNGSETRTWFEYGATTDLGSVTAPQSAGNGKSLTNVSVSISGLSGLTKYYFRMNAQNAYGTVNGEILSFTTLAPASADRPMVDTTAATAVTGTTVKLNGQLNPNGAATTYWFEYGKSSSLASPLSTAEEQLASGTSDVSVLANVSGLDRDSRYYFRLVGRNQYGTVRGDIMSFTTQK